MSINYEIRQMIEENNVAGRQAETDDDLELAIKHYEDNIKENYADAFSYNRLMMIYRKLKKVKDELRVIKKGIQVFSTQHENQFKARKNKKVSELSHAFMTKAGLKDKKGNYTYYPEPVNKWMKRKAVVEEKIKKAAGAKK